MPAPHDRRPSSPLTTERLGGASTPREAICVAASELPSDDALRATNAALADLLDRHQRRGTLSAHAFTVQPGSRTGRLFCWTVAANGGRIR